MTKKQMKQLATKIANLETIIQTSNDENAIREAKNRMIQLNESAELDLNDMIKLDAMISDLLNKEKI
jgi:hypothetical protein